MAPVPASAESDDVYVAGLFERVVGADEAERLLIENEIVERHLGLAQALAHRYAGRGADRDDLVQVANLALVKAMRGYQSDKGAFAPFATATILGELKRHFRDRCWMVRPPRRVQELQADVTATVTDLWQRTGRTPSSSSIADELEIDVDEVREAQAASGCFTVTSLDRPTTEGGRPMGESIRASEDPFAAVDELAAVRPAIAELSFEDRYLLRLRFVEEMTQQQIAQRVGVSQMQVSRRLTRVLTTLRATVTSEPLAG